MSSLSKGLSALPLPSLFAVLFQIIMIILILILFKLSLKWWCHLFSCKQAIQKSIQNSKIQTNNKQISQLNGQEGCMSKDEKYIVLKTVKTILTVYSLLELCSANSSTSKMVFLVIVQISFYCLFCTQIFIGNIQYGILLFDLSQATKIIGCLGWIGIVVVSLALWISKYSINVLTKLSQKNRIENQKQVQQRSVDRSSLRLPFILYAKLVVLTSIVVVLCLSSILHILKFNNLSPSTDQINYFQLKIFSYYRITNSFIMLAILMAAHQAFLLLFSFLLGILFSKLSHERQQRILIFFFVLRQFQGQPSIVQNRIVPIHEESLQNLDYNVFQQQKNIYFQQENQYNLNKQKLQSQQNNEKFNAVQEQMNDEISNMRNKIVFRRLRSSKKKLKNKTSFVLKQLHINADKFKNIQFCKTNQHLSKLHDLENKNLQLSHIENSQNQYKQVKNEELKNTNDFIRGFQKFKKCSNQPQKSSTSGIQKPYQDSQAEQIITRQKIKRKIYTISEPILCNIENKINEHTSKEPVKKLRSKNQLKIRSFFQNQQDIQMVDLSKYIVKNLGCVKSTTSVQNSINSETKSCLFSNDNSTLKSLQNSQLKFQKRAKKRRSYCQKPNVPQQTENVYTFCLQDFKQNQ